MIVHRAPQGSSEWHAARAGAITASNFCVARSRTGGLTEQQQKYVDAIRSGCDEIGARTVAGYKAAPKSTGIEKALLGLPVGDFSDASKNYAFRLAIERISGQPLDEGFELWSAKRGHELEPEARRSHEAKTGLLIEEVGFVTTDDGLFGASADGFIEGDGGSEYKCFLAPDKLRPILLDNDISDAKDQVQGCMWVTGRKFWHFVLYCPALAGIGRDLTIIEVQRDDDYINALELDLVAFNRLVAEYEDKLRANPAQLRKAA